MDYFVYWNFLNDLYWLNVTVNKQVQLTIISEGLNAWNAHELGRLVHRFGGSPVGSFMQPPARPLMPSMSHAMFLDQTHDNESPIMVRKSILTILAPHVQHHLLQLRHLFRSVRQ